jgi:anti-sigma factor RsiW
VGRLLREDQELAYRVSRLQQTQAQLLDTFGALLRDGVSLTAKPARQQSRGRGAALQGGKGLTYGMAALMLLIGASAGFTGAYYSGLSASGGESVAPLPPANWPADIAEFHSFFTKDTLRVSPESQSNPEMVRFQLAQLSKSAIVPDFSQQGVKFARGQMLSHRGNKVMQLAYSGKNEPLIAIYISSGGLDMPMSPGQFGDVNTISWSARELRFVIAADMPHQALKALAAIAQSQFEGR